jgi:hypothetical protein
MTRKDYVLIAEALNLALTKATEYKYDTAGIYFTIGALSQTLVGDNPRFDQAKFLAAVEKDVA